MGKGIKRASKQDKDFAKKKYKVGRTLKKAQNETTVDVRVRKLNLPGQNALEEKGILPTTEKNLTLKDVLAQCGHYSEKVRRAGLQGVGDLLSAHPAHLSLHLALVVQTLAPRIADADKAVRGTLHSVWEQAILPGLPPAALGPFVHLLMAHLCGAMTHLHLDIRSDALAFLDLLVGHAPALVTASHTDAVLHHFAHILSQGQRTRTLKGRSTGTLLFMLRKLLRFLQAAALGARKAALPAAAVASTDEPQLWQQRGLETSHDDGWETLQAADAAIAQRVLPPPASLALVPAAVSYLACSREPTQVTGINSAAASGQRSSGSKAAASVVSSLLECWEECAPGQMSLAPDAVCLDCIVTLLDCLRLLANMLQLPQPENEASEEQRQVQSQVWTFLTKRASVVFPVTVPAVAPTEAMSHGLVRFNTLLAHLLANFLPMLSHHASAAVRSENAQTVANDGADALAFAAVHSSNLFASFNSPAATLCAASVETPAAHAAWLGRLLEYYEGVITHGVAVANQQGLASAGAGLAAPAASFAAALEGLAQALPHVGKERRQGALNAMSAALTSKLATSRRIEAVHFQRRICAAPAGIPAATRLSWMRALPQAVWELSGKHPRVAASAIEVLHSGVRLAAASDGDAAFLDALQVTLLPCFGVEVAAKGRTPAAFVPGPLLRLSATTQAHALDLVPALAPLSDRTMRTLRLVAASSLTHSDTVTRVVDMLTTRPHLCPPRHLLPLLLSSLCACHPPCSFDRPLPCPDKAPAPVLSCLSAAGSSDASPRSDGADPAWQRHASLAAAAARALATVCRSSPLAENLVLTWLAARVEGSQDAPPERRFREAFGALQLLQRLAQKNRPFDADAPYWGLARRTLLVYCRAWLQVAHAAAARGSVSNAQAAWPAAPALPHGVANLVHAVDLIAACPALLGSLLHDLAAELTKEATAAHGDEAAGQPSLRLCDLQAAVLLLWSFARRAECPQTLVAVMDSALRLVTAVEAVGRTDLAGDARQQACTKECSRLRARLHSLASRSD